MSISRFALLTAIFSLFLLSCSTSQPLAVNFPEAADGLHYDTPATVWDEAIPLGNGIMGALVWGDGQPLKFSLDRADLWDLRSVPEFHSEEYTFEQMRAWHREGRVGDLKRVYEEPYNRPAPTKIPAGRIELTLGDSFQSADLNLRQATASAHFAPGISANAFVHAAKPVGMIRIRGGEPSLALIAPAFAGEVTEAAAGGIGAGDLRQLGYPAPVETGGETWKAYSQQGAEGFNYAVHVAWRQADGEWQAAWSTASSFEGEDPSALARTRAEEALAAGYSELHASHDQWWNGFWRASSVHLPNAVIQRQWFLEQYKFGSAARRGAPPITLQAVWTADDGKLPPWKGDYHHDLNTQLSYWPCYAGNHLEDGLGYLDWLWDTRGTAFDWTKRFFEKPGLNVPMTVDLNGNQIGGWRQYTHSATTAAWLAHHFYLHWKYSADDEFLRERAYPYLRDAAVFLEAFTAGKGPDGLRTYPLSASPEINDNRPEAWFDTVTNYDLALTRWLFTATAGMAAAVGETEEAARWNRALDELPALTVGEDGGLLVAANYPLTESHRHFSHLMAIHPLGLIDWSGGPGAQRTISASLDHLGRLGTDRWTGYSFSWQANLAARARDGATAEKALEIFSTAFTLRSSFHCNGDQSGKGYSKFTYRPFTLEGNFAAAAAVHEMLIQSHTGTIVLFPAIPDSWQDVGFTTLRAEGAFLISAERQAGKTVQIEITAEKGGECRIESPFSGKLLTLDMDPGETRVLRADP
jgi:alpha-L-fucosidase 2